VTILVKSMLMEFETVEAAGCSENFAPLNKFAELTSQKTIFFVSFCSVN
jgi:hypothetical protein